MVQSNVSAEFNKAFNRTSGIKEAQTAENTMGASIKQPVGDYRVVFASLFLGVSEKKADGKGGNMYANMDVVILEGDYKGQKVTKNQTFVESGDYTVVDKMAWFLNELEILGLPRTIRENGGPEDWVNHFASQDPAPVFIMKIVSKESKGKTYKNIQFYPESQSVDNSSSIMPGDSTIAPPSQSSSTTVNYLGQEWDIISETESPEGTMVEIKSRKTNKIRKELKSELLG